MAIKNLISLSDNGIIIEAEHVKAIAAEARKRTDALEVISAGHTSYDISSIDGDVEDNTAASYN